jgi:hypothetical protein
MAVASSNWYLIKFLPFPSAAWQAVVAADWPALPGLVGTTIAAWTSGGPDVAELLLYCTYADGTSASFIGDGVNHFQVPVAVIDADTAQTTNTQALGSGGSWVGVRRGDGAYVFYDDRMAVIDKITSPGALATFLS